MLTESEISGLTCTKVACVRRECYRSHRASQQICRAHRTHIPTAAQTKSKVYLSYCGQLDICPSVMLDTEGQWSEALNSNNVRAIIRWLRKLIDEGEGDWEQILPTFRCWVQRMSEFAKNELLTLCFSRCRGLWMFLDRSSFTRVHMLLQRLNNLLSLVQCMRRQLNSTHFWHGVGIPCVACRDTFSSSDVRRGCWNREHRALKQYIWLGRLVQWWGIMGLLPKYPEPHEMKRISQMWKEIVHRHQRACLETPGWSSFIQGMVTQLDKQHGCIWTSEDCTYQCYPPPNLRTLLKLVLVPRIDNMSVQAILMYFILDMANFLQCKDDLLQSFCHAFTIPSSFSQQIRAFWMLDHGHIKASIELLLSPRAAVPHLSWQHSCIINCLLTRKQPQLALRYIHWTRPAIETIEDAKLCADVMLQNSCVSAAWSLLKRGHTEGEDMVMYFLLSCKRFGLHAEALKYIPTGCHHEGHKVNGTKTTGSQLTLKQRDCSAGRPLCPLSAKLYQTQKENTASPEELLRLVRESVMEMRKPQPNMRMVVWPEQAERKLNSREMFLSTQALRHLTPSPSPKDTAEEAEQTAHTDQPEEEQPVVDNQRESREHISSSEDLSSESVSAFTSASSLPLLRQCCPYVYESTLTLQRISSLLTDAKNQSREDKEQESGTPSSGNILLHTPDGTTDPVSPNKNIVGKLVLSGEEAEENVKMGVFSSEDSLSVDAVSGPSMDETVPLHKRMSRFPQVYCNDVSQSVPFIYESQVESHRFLSPDCEKLACCKEVSEEIVDRLSNVSDPWSTVSQEEQSDCIPPWILISNEATTNDSFLQEKPKQKGCKLRQQEEALGCFSRDLLCALSQSETTQNLQTDLHLMLAEPTLTGSGPLAGTGEQDSSHITPAYSFIYPTQLTTGPAHDTQTYSAVFDATNGSTPTTQLKTAEPCVPSASDWLSHCKVDSSWKQDTETDRTSSSLQRATEPGVAITTDNKRTSLVPNQLFSYSLINFMDFTAKQKGDNTDGKQADKGEPTAWSSLASQGAIRSGRTRSRKSKRVKRT